MRQPGKSGSDEHSPQRKSAYGTQFSPMNTGVSEFAEASRDAGTEIPLAGRKTDSRQETFGTVVPKPLNEAGPSEGAIERALPSLDNFLEVSRTRKAEGILPGLPGLPGLPSAAGVRNRPYPGQEGRSPSDSGEATIILRSEPSDPGIGKSTWNLKIHRRQVSGHVSGFANPMPESLDEKKGLLSSFLDESDAPEYEVLGELAAGNMGVVYNARQLSLNRGLAIKTLKADAGSAERDQAMFVSEAVITANLVHPNIVPIHDLGRTEDGKLFYSMKKVIGVPWHSEIRKRSLEDNIDVFMKVCDAVAYAHSRGVINRDLKPENVIVGDYGEVIVLDWGLAITTEKFEKRNSVLLDVRGTAGTPVYMAPELLDYGISAVGAHSDIYLLGAILFEAIEGFPPHLLRRFWSLDGSQIFDAVINAVRENEIEEEVAHPGELMQIARKAMSTHPSDRYSSVEALQEAIREHRITGRAEELLISVDPRTASDYTAYQSAVALYGEAIRKWPDNHRASSGDRRARLAYAELAERKGDIDLGLQVVENQTDEMFRPVVLRLKKSRLIRRIVRATWGVTTVAAISLMIVSYLLMLGAEASKEAAVTAREATQQALDTNKELHGTNEELAAKAKAAKDEAEAATAMATKQTQKAADATLEAEKAQEQANMETARANAETTRAKEASVIAAAEAMKAAAETARAEKAKKDTLTAQETAAQAEKAAAAATAMLEQARTERYKSELEGYNIKIRAAQELGQYTEVIRIAEEACAKSELNPLIKKEESLLKERIKDAVQQGGNAEIRLPKKPDSAGISSDGSTVVVYSRGKEKSVGVLRNKTGLNAPTFIQSMPAIQSIPAVLKGDVQVEVSSNGECICLYGKSERQFWQLQGDRYEQLTIEDDQFAANPVDADWCFFSSNGQHVYLAGKDQKATVDIYAIESGVARHLLRQPLAKGATLNYTIRDIVLLPDESSLIAEFEAQPCRQFWLKWDEGKPVFQKLAGDAPERGPIKLQLANTLNKADKLFVSPDGRQIAFIFSRRVVLLPRVETAGSDRFSFAAAEDNAAAVMFASTMTVTDLAFSADGSVIATGHGSRYIQIWDRDGSTYVPCKNENLYFHQPTSTHQQEAVFGRCLRGHSGIISTLQFANGDSDHLISVGTDLSVRTWQLSTYGSLVSGMEKVSRAFESQTVVEPVTTSMSDHRRNALPDPNATGRRRGNPGLAELRKAKISQYLTTGAKASSPLTAVAQEGTSGERKMGRNIFSARFSPDGSRLLIGADDLAAHVLDSATGQMVAGSTGGRRDLFFDPERNFFSEGHISQISSVQFIPPDGELLLSADYFGSISVWDSQLDGNGSGYERSRLLSEYSASEFAISDDGLLILAGGASTTNPNAGLTDPDADLNHMGMLWNKADLLKSPSPEPVLTLTGQHTDGAITAVGISPASERLVTAGRRGKIVIWNARDGSVIASVDGAHGRDQVVGIFFESETQLVSAGYDGKILRWNVEGTGLKATEITGRNDQRPPEFIVRLRPSPDRTSFATAEVSIVRNESGEKTSELNVLIWTQDVARPLLRRPIIIPEGDKETAFRQDISWSSNGKELMFVQDGTITVFETTDWKATRRLKLNAKDARPIRGAFAPAKNGVSDQVATFDGRFTHLWDLETRKHLAEFRSHAAYNVAAFSADQKLVATASETLRIFDADETSPNHGRTIYRLPLREHHQHPLSDVAFSPTPGETRLATIDSVGTIELWQWQLDADTPLTPSPGPASTENEIAVWAEEQKLMFGNSVEWGPDGKSLAALQMGVLSLWKFQDHQPERVEISMPEGWQCRFNQIDLSQKLNYLAAGGVAWNETEGLQSFAAVWDLNGEFPRLLATISKEHSVDKFTKKPRHTDLTEYRRTGVTALAFDEARNHIITGGADGRLIRWGFSGLSETSVASLGVINDMKQTSGEAPSVTAVDVTSTGRIVTADQNGYFTIWPSKEN